MTTLDIMKRVVELEEKKEKITKYIKVIGSHYHRSTMVIVRPETSDFNHNEGIEFSVNDDLFTAYLLNERKEIEIEIKDQLTRLGGVYKPNL